MTGAKVSGPRSRVPAVAAVVAVVLAVVIGGVLVQSLRDTTGEEASAPAGDATPRPDGGSDGELAAAAADTYGLGIGDPDAPVKVEVFEDFLCPFCREYETAARDALRQAAADGHVYVVYRPIAILNDYSARAMNALGVVLEESGGDVALALHDRLFEEQPAEGGPMPDDSWLVEQAVAAGANEAAVAPGIEGGSFAQWVVNGTDEASRRGVSGTPTVFVDGEPITGAASIEDLVARTTDGITAGH